MTDLPLAFLVICGVVATATIGVFGWLIWRVGAPERREIAQGRIPSPSTSPRGMESIVLGAIVAFVAAFVVFLAGGAWGVIPQAAPSDTSLQDSFAILFPFANRR